MSARVLVCDDEPQILRALRIVLRDAGYAVVPVATGREALDAAALQAPDAAIVDLVLPDFDGVEVTRGCASGRRPRSSSCRRWARRRRRRSAPSRPGRTTT